LKKAMEQLKKIMEKLKKTMEKLKKTMEKLKKTMEILKKTMEKLTKTMDKLKRHETTKNCKKIKNPKAILHPLSFGAMGLLPALLRFTFSWWLPLAWVLRPLCGFC